MEENHYNCIYMYTNKINGKRYVGKAEDFLERKQTHIYISYNKKANGYNVPFHRAIRKYGIENFEATILKENLTEDEMNYWEDYYIETFDLYAKNGKGYNVAKGGGGGNLRKGKTKEEIKEIRQKKINTWKNKTEEEMEEIKQKKSEAMKGKKHSEEARQKMIKSRKGKFTGENNPNSKRVAQYDKQGNLIKIWDCSMNIQRELEISQSSICQCCKFWDMDCNKEEWFKTHKNRPKKTAGGYIWRYAEELE